MSMKWVGLKTARAGWDGTGSWSRRRLVERLLPWRLVNVLWEAVIWRASVYSDINHLSTSIDLIHNCVVNHAYFSLPFPSSTTFQSSSSSSNSNLGPGGWLPNLTQYFSLTRQCCNWKRPHVLSKQNQHQQSSIYLLSSYQIRTHALSSPYYTRQSNHSSHSTPPSLQHSRLPPHQQVLLSQTLHSLPITPIHILLFLVNIVQEP